LLLSINAAAVDDISLVDLEKSIALVSLRAHGALFRHNRDITFQRPKGPLGAELKSVAQTLARQKSGLVKDDFAELLASWTTSKIDACHGLSDWGKRYPLLRLTSGWLEQIVVVLGVFCVAVFLFVLLLYRSQSGSMLFALRVAESILDIVPYIGFFGTIFGMAEALWILGAIDISDPVQKSTQLGPITGDISLAMETSQLGLIVWIAGSFASRLVRVAIREPV
jgi:hypothetical protein